MRESPMRWEPLETPGTFVRAYQDSPWEGFKPAEVYRIAGLRRVVHPSIHQIVESAAETAEVIERGLRDERVEQSSLYTLMKSASAAARRSLIERRPEVLIPFLGLSAPVLAPLQLLGPVPCIRTYSCRLDGAEAHEVYDASGEKGTAPEVLIPMPSTESPTFRVRYVDTLWANQKRPWPTNPLVLISNAKITAHGHIEHSQSELQNLVELAVSLPALQPRELQKLPVVPDGHFDWAIGAMLQAVLGIR